MKSAFEIAMERLEKESGPTKKLTEAQKAAIAEIERRYDAKIAEQKLAFEPRLAGIAPGEEHEKVQSELTAKLTALEKQRDQEKEAVWSGS
ncbi:MAG: hypothetical protein HY706_07630 [Candidatus Hydrogenedentes bacterium]|nr:hypothetical protein [Candidatus Hydrogenedentota bacterium]